MQIIPERPVVIARDHRYFRNWCRESGIHYMKATYVVSPDNLRGERFWRIVFLGWPRSWSPEQIRFAQAQLAMMEATEKAKAGD